MSVHRYASLTGSQLSKWLRHYGRHQPWRRCRWHFQCGDVLSTCTPIVKYKGKKKHFALWGIFCSQLVMTRFQGRNISTYLSFLCLSLYEVGSVDEQYTKRKWMVYWEPRDLVTSNNRTHHRRSSSKHNDKTILQWKGQGAVSKHI